MAVLGVTTCGSPVAAKEPSAAVTTSRRSRVNVPTKTLGGGQFWGDVRFFRGWRIQQNVLTRHFRLLDPGNVRRAWGSKEDCETALNAVREQRQLAPMSGEAVVLLHGIVRTARSMDRLRKQLEKDGYTVVPFEYPSTRVRIEESAEYLDQVIDSLAGITEIHFVTHSMGGLVVRAWLKSHHDCRIGRMVMLGVPNLGACIADRLKANLVYRVIYGPAGQQLGTDPDGLIAALPTPRFEFAVIAGVAEKPDGYNPLVPGDDDGTVALESTRLPGATDFASVKALHSFLMLQPAVIDYTRRFLREGRLRKEGPRQPILLEQPTAGE